MILHSSLPKQIINKFQTWFVLIFIYLFFHSRAPIESDDMGSTAPCFDAATMQISSQSYRIDESLAPLVSSKLLEFTILLADHLFDELLFPLSTRSDFATLSAYAKISTNYMPCQPFAYMTDFLSGNSSLRYISSVLIPILFFPKKTNSLGFMD